MDGDETGRKKFSPHTQPMCCSRATDAPWRQGTVTRSLAFPTAMAVHLSQRLLQSTISNYLSRSPTLQTFLNWLAITSIGLIFIERLATRAFTYPPSLIKVCGLTMKIGGGSFQPS